jgi:hypothetical protein
MMFFSHKSFVYLILTLLALSLIACGPATAAEPESAFKEPPSNKTGVHQEEERSEEADHDHTHLADVELTAGLNVVMVSTELVVGPERFSVGLFDEARNMIHEAEVHFHYYDLSDPEQAVLEMEADAERLHSAEGPTTIYTHDRSFDRAGDWGVEVEAHLPDGSTARQRIGFRVNADSQSPTPGDEVPAFKTPTLADVGNDLSLLTSALEPNPAFYEISLAEAVNNGKPTVLLFATPAFCQSRFCGPAYDTINDLHRQYGDRINFIHVEVFSGLPNPAANGFKVTPAVEAFGLQSDPWAYLIDEQGTVLYRVEGLFSTAELERQLQTRLEL